MKQRNKHIEIFLMTITLLVILITSGCGGDPRKIEHRLETFKNCIGPEAAMLFDSGDDSACTALIEEKIKTDIIFKEAYKRMKAAEAIDLFSTREVVSYFREYFADVIDMENSTR